MSEKKCSLCGSNDTVQLNYYGGSRDLHVSGSLYLCKNCAKKCSKCGCIIQTNEIKQLLENWRQEEGWEEIGSIDFCECEKGENEQQESGEQELNLPLKIIQKIFKNEWVETFLEMVDDIFNSVQKIFDKYAVFVIASILFIGFWYFIVMIALQLINEHITPLPMFRFKPYEGYIYAFPDSDRAKNYRLKYKKTENGFFLFFPNGGSKYFEDCEEFNLEGDSFSCYTEKDTRDWEFRCYKRDIKE